MMSEEPIRELIDKTTDALMQGVDFGLAENVIPKEMSEKLERDVFVFSGCKTYQELREASQLLRDERGQVKPFRSFFEEVKALHPTYNEQYLEAEYGFAVHSAQSAAKWAQIEQDGDTYDLQYRTAGDGLVRPAHAALNGVTLPPSDPFWLKYMIPNGWRCRCNAVQVRKGKYPRSDSTEAIERGEKATTDLDGQGRNRAEMFRFNPGKDKVIFPKNHPYYNLSTGAKVVISDLVQEKKGVATRKRDNATKRIQDMIDEMPDNLTLEEKKAIAGNNIAIERATGRTKGAPMIVAEADKQNANPNYGKEFAYSINCQTCAPAYALRSRGFDVTAKPCIPGSKLEHLSRGNHAWEVWKNIDGTPSVPIRMVDWLKDKGYQKMTEKRYREFFNEACKDEGIYELSIGWKRGGGHATILQRFEDGALKYIEPQHDNSEGSGREFLNIDFLCKSGATARVHECRGIMRIDNKLFNPDHFDIFAD